MDVMHELRKILKQQRGSSTLEATMVFPVLFFSLFLILFLGIVLYQEVNLQSLAVRASERGAVVYSSRVSDMIKAEKQLSDFKIRDPYRNVPFIGGYADSAYVSIVNRYVGDKIHKGNILNGNTKNAGNYTTIENHLIVKRILVNIQSDYVMALSIPEIFGHKGPFNVNTSAVSAVVDTPDFIRNVDIVSDILKKTEVFGNIDSAFGKVKEALDKALDIIK